MRDIRTRRMAWAALPVAGVLLLAGCGDDDKDEPEASAPATSAPATSAPATSAPATSAPATTGAASSAPAAGAVDQSTFSADQKAAADAYTKVFDAKTPVADRKALIQDADKIGPMLDAMLGNPMLASVTVKTNDVKLSGDKGTVNFEILLGGAPSGMPARDGDTVKQDGKWKVGGKTICTLAGVAQVPTAPECATFG